MDNILIRMIYRILTTFPIRFPENETWVHIGTAGEKVKKYSGYMLRESKLTELPSVIIQGRKPEYILHYRRTDFEDYANETLPIYETSMVTHPKKDIVLGTTLYKGDCYHISKDIVRFQGYAMVKDLTEDEFVFWTNDSETEITVDKVGDFKLEIWNKHLDANLLK